MANLYEPGDGHFRGTVEAEGGFTVGGAPVRSANSAIIGDIGSGYLVLGTDPADFPAWGTEIDAGGVVQPGSPYSLRAPRTGYYMIIVALFGSGATSDVVSVNLGLLVNGGGVGGASCIPASDGGFYVSSPNLLPLNEGDLVTLQGFRVGGTAETAATAAADLALIYMGS